MPQQLQPDRSHSITILFEAVPEDEHDPDPAAVEAAGRETISALRDDGYTVTSVYTGQRSGGLYEVLPAVQATVQYAMTYKDQIVSLLKPILAHVSEVRAKHLEPTKQEEAGIKIEFSLGKDQPDFKAESPNLAGNELIAELARELMDLHLQIVMQEAPRIVDQDTPGSVVKIISRVPKRKPRRRR